MGDCAILIAGFVKDGRSWFSWAQARGTVLRILEECDPGEGRGEGCGGSTAVGVDAPRGGRRTSLWSVTIIGRERGEVGDGEVGTE